MGFHEVQFPPDISVGSSGGPGFSTSVIVTDSGAEQRVARWTQSRRKYDVAEAVKTQQNMSDIRDFYITRQGLAFGFRYKDWSDYNTTSSGSYDHDTGQTNLDVVIGAGTGALTQFQLIKNYTSGGVTRVRNIKKPVAGTIKVAVNGVNTTTFTTDTTTGIITFAAAPANGTVITAGFEFDTPVRFGDALDDHLPLTIEDYNIGSTQITLVEILDVGEQPDEYFYGGAAEVAITSNYQLSASLARTYVFNTTVASVLFLPDFTNLAPGAPYFYLINDSVSTQTLTLKTFGGATTICIIAAGVAMDVILSVDNFGVKVWYAK